MFCSQMSNYCAMNLFVPCWTQSKKTTWNRCYSLMNPLFMYLGMLTAPCLDMGYWKPTRNMWTRLRWSKAKYVVRAQAHYGDKLYFFYEKAITCGVWIHKLYAVPQLEELQSFVTFKQDGVPTHWTNKVWIFLD
jgi:hypothetical protein